MAKLLDYDGLQYLYNKLLTKFPEGTDFSEEFKIESDSETNNITSVSLNIDKELDATSPRPVENQAIKLGIDGLRKDIEDQVDTSNTFFYVLYNQVMPYVGSGSITNTYTSSCYCVKNGAVVTIYFDIEGNYGNTIFPITEVVPSSARPYVDVTNLIAQSVNGFNNISVDSSNGQILITSENGVFNVHCVITYVVVPANIDPENPDIDPEVEARIYNVKARMIKIGDYYPTYNSSNNTMSGYSLRGAALTTDVSGSQFSGYEGNYTVYLQNANITQASNNEQFYWSKKFGDTVDSEGKGSLFTFNECFEIASTVDDAALIEHGCSAVKELVETGDTIQYFVTAFGKHAWIGGVNSPNKDAIKDKAYGATTGAGDYNGRFYWTDCILAHVLRFIPASIEEGGAVEIPDKTRPVIIDGTTVGYIDKVVPLKLVDKAYSWGNFSYSGGSTWRGAKLYCEDIPTPSTEALNEKFSGHLVISDWNKASSTGNIYSNDTYYQRIDSKLNEVEESGGRPSWFANDLPDYSSIIDAKINRDFSSEDVSYDYTHYYDLARLGTNGKVYITRIIKAESTVGQLVDSLDGSEPLPMFTFGEYDPYTAGLNFYTIGATATVCYDTVGGQWDGDTTYEESYTPITSSFPSIDSIDPYEATVEEQFILAATIDYNTPSISSGLTVSTIQQSPVYARPNATWNKTSNKLDSYTGDEFN